MLRLKLIEYVLQLKNGRALLQDRCAFPQIYFSSKYTATPLKPVSEKKEKDDDEEVDTPIKFSTSKAARFPAAYTVAEARGVPWYQGIVISASLAVFLLYFCLLREENDIDQNMVKNMPPELVDQIYGKHRNPNNGK